MCSLRPEQTKWNSTPITNSHETKLKQKLKQISIQDDVWLTVNRRWPDGWWFWLLGKLCLHSLRLAGCYVKMMPNDRFASIAIRCANRRKMSEKKKTEPTEENYYNLCHELSLKMINCSNRCWNVYRAHRPKFISIHQQQHTFASQPSQHVGAIS